VDAAHAVDDARRVVGVAREANEVLLLLVEALERGALVVLAVIDDALEPVGELLTHVVEVAELAAIEEGALHLPEGALGPRLVVRVSASDRERAKLVVARKGEEARIVDGLVALPSQHDRLLAVVLAYDRARAEAF